MKRILSFVLLAAFAVMPTFTFAQKASGMEINQLHGPTNRRSVCYSRRAVGSPKAHHA